VANGQEMIDVTGHGYFDQLGRYYVDRDYSSDEISVIVKDILDNDVVTPSDISYDAGDVAATSYTPDTLEFNTDAKSALETLADIAGSREWGVDKDRKFFFKAKSTTPGFYFTMGRYVTDFQADQSFGDIINRVIVQGGESSGSPFTRTVNDTDSQTKYGRRDKVIQNSSITTRWTQYPDRKHRSYSVVCNERIGCDLRNKEIRRVSLFGTDRAGNIPHHI